MFLHQLKYDLLSMIRTKEIIIWLLIFPNLILGVLFKVAFGGAYEKSTVFHTIPAAVVETGDPYFREVCEAVSKGDEPLLKPVFTDEDEAEEMLKDGRVKGIFYAGQELSLSVSKSGIEQTLLSSFADSYSVRKKVIVSAAQEAPEKLPEVISALESDIEPYTEVPVTHGNTDYFVQYFYNLLAMVAMYGSLLGLNITQFNQANLSPVGARKGISPVPKSIGIGASLTASMIVEALCMAVNVSFTVFVLKVDMGSRLPLVYLAAIAGGFLGVALGFFIGACNNLKFNAKVGISMAFSMLMCFLSGLMVGNIKAIIQQHLPIINKLNPAAVISDSIYCLDIYPDLSHFLTKLTTMVIMSAVLMIAGIAFTRRKKYASI